MTLPRRPLTFTLLAVLGIGCSSPAWAQPYPDYPPPRPEYRGYPEAPGQWVGPEGQVFRGYPPRPERWQPHGPDRAAERDGWLEGCRHHLEEANQGHGVPASFDDACHAWLNYYEATGYADHGYGFSTTIPVSVSTIPGRCEPCPPEPAYSPKRHWLRPKPMHDKRIHLGDKRIRLEK